MISDTVKVTYNTYSCAISGMIRERMKMDGRDSVECHTYSCAISGMIRERMKMDGRDSAECQNWEKKDRCHFGIV